VVVLVAVAVGRVKVSAVAAGGAVGGLGELHVRLRGVVVVGVGVVAGCESTGGVLVGLRRDVGGWLVGLVGGGLVVPWLVGVCHAGE